MHADINQIREEILKYSEILNSLEHEVYKVLIGQKALYSRILIALLTGGHILLEGLPGLAKTTIIRTISQCLQSQFQRIQFTPDLLPADLIGTQIYNPKDGSFTVKKGPIFANIILADEINRAPAKVQSALLEAMQRAPGQYSKETFTLDEPFMVMATQNPIEQEGTYPLPEAQVDRFMLKVKVGYPQKDEERKILDRFTEGEVLPVKAVLDPDTIFKMRAVVQKIYIDEKSQRLYFRYCLCHPPSGRCGAERRFTKKQGLELQPNDLPNPDQDAQPIPFKDLIEYGASPRATIYLTIAAKAAAFLEGRGYVTPQDVKNVAHDVLRHRLLLSYEAEANEWTVTI